MGPAVYVSRIAEALEAKHLTVPRLRERLAARGYRVSRGALTRLVSDEPIEEIRLSVIRPVLDELDMTFESAFAQIDPGVVDAHRQARFEANRLASLAAGRAATKDADVKGESDPSAELREVIARALEQIHATHPEVLDRRDRVRRRALAKAIAARLGDARTLTSEEYSRLIASGLNRPGSAALLHDLDA